MNEAAQETGGATAQSRMAPASGEPDPRSAPAPGGAAGAADVTWPPTAPGAAAPSAQAEQLAPTSQHTTAAELDGVIVVDRDGKEVGQVLAVHPDPFTGRPAWVTVKAGLLHGRSLVPVGDEPPVDGRLRVPYDSDTIKKAPYVDLAAQDETVVAEEEARDGADESIVDDRQANRAGSGDHWRVYEYYGIPFGRPDVAGSAAPDVEYLGRPDDTLPEANRPPG